MVKLGTVIPYLKKIQKVYESRNTPFEFCRNQHFLPEISNFCYMKKYRYRLHFNTQFPILLTVFEFLRVVLINRFTILMMSAKLGTIGFTKENIF